MSTSSPSAPGQSAYIASVREQHPRAYEPWTAEEDTRLVDEHRAGRSYEDVARDLGRQPSAVESRLMKVAPELFGSARHSETPELVGQVRDGHARVDAVWTDVEEARLVAGFAADIGFEDLAVEFGREPGVLRARLARLAYRGLRA